MRRLGLLLWIAACCPNPSTAPPALDATATPPPPPVAPTAGPLSLTFVDDHNFAGGTMVDGYLFGGISAIAWDAPRQRLIALSDAHKANAPARMFDIFLRLDDRDLSARITGVTKLGGLFADGGLDPEGIAADGPGRWVISTEGDGEGTPRLAPALFRITTDGGVTSQHALPEKWSPTPEGDLTRGVFHNKGIEGLTSAPSGKVLFAISELPLAQDGPPPTFDHGGSLRLMRLDPTLSVVAEHHYRASPAPRLAEHDVERVLNGVSALCAVGDTRVLVMERAAVRAAGVYHNRIQIFEVDVHDAADVSALETLSESTPALEKRLVLDLDEVLPELEEGQRSLDNFEGMALGPLLPSGKRSLLMVTDDNFKDTQRTVLLAFSVEGSLR